MPPRNNKNQQALEYEFIQRNTKNQQGLYLRIRTKKPHGKKERWKEYKYQLGDLIDIYFQDYIHKQKKGKKKQKIGLAARRKIQRITNIKEKQHKTNIAWKGHKKYLRQLAKRGTINQNIQTGVTRTIIDPNTMSRQKMYTAYKELLEPLVLDNELLNFVINNAHKFSHNFRYDTNIRGTSRESGNTTHLATIKDIGHRNIEKYLTDYITSNIARTGALVDSQKWKMFAKNHLSLPDNNITMTTPGTIRQVTTTITYMRGKKI